VKQWLSQTKPTERDLFLYEKLFIYSNKIKVPKVGSNVIVPIPMGAWPKNG
jgi:hypothetical protein